MNRVLFVSALALALIVGLMYYLDKDNRKIVIHVKPETARLDTTIQVEGSHWYKSVFMVKGHASDTFILNGVRYPPGEVDFETCGDYYGDDIRVTYDPYKGKNNHLKIRYYLFQ